VLSLPPPPEGLAPDPRGVTFLASCLHHHRVGGCRGAFSTVRLGENRETSEQVAIKIIEKKNVVTENAKKNLDREIQILVRVHHPSTSLPDRQAFGYPSLLPYPGSNQPPSHLVPDIVSMKDLYDTGDRFLFVMELVTGGEVPPPPPPQKKEKRGEVGTLSAEERGAYVVQLFDRIVKKGSYSEEDAQTLVRQILQGVAYLHSNGIAHRDLKVRLPHSGRHACSLTQPCSPSSSSSPKQSKAREPAAQNQRQRL